MSSDTSDEQSEEDVVQQRLVRLLEQVADSYPVTSGDYETCTLCGRYWKEKEGAIYDDEYAHPHNPDCPVIEAPKILKILKANSPVHTSEERG